MSIAVSTSLLPRSKPKLRYDPKAHRWIFTYHIQTRKKSIRRHKITKHDGN